MSDSYSCTLTRRQFAQASIVAGWMAASAKGAPADAPWPADKLAICNETFRDWPHEKACRYAAELGYRGLEIAPFTFHEDVTQISADRRREIRGTAEAAGLQIVGLHWLLARTKGLHLTSPDGAVREKTTEYLVQLARFCHDLGGGVMVFGSPKQRNLLDGVSREQGLEYAAQVLRKAMPELARLNVVLALEPLSPRTTNFMTTAADGVELARRVDSPQCRLLLDCLAMSSEPTPIPELIGKHHEWLVHFHANDPNSRGPGMGDLDFHPILAALRSVDYRGWLSVEVFDYKPGSEALATQSFNYLQQVAAKRNP